MIIVECSKCSREIRADNQYAGRIARCPDCNQRVAIPALEADGSAPTTPQTPAPPAVARQRTPVQARPNRRAGRSGSTGILWEVKRIRIFHAGLFGVMVGAAWGFLQLLVLFMIGMLAGDKPLPAGSGQAFLSHSAYVLIGMPIAFGITFLLSAAIYNIASSLVGGCKVQLQHSV